MDPAPTTHLQNPGPRQPAQAGETASNTAGIPSGIEAGLVFAVGTAFSACSISPVLMASATSLLLWGAWFIERRKRQRHTGGTLKRKVAWLCILCWLGWLSYQSVAKPGNASQDAPVESGPPTMGTVRGIVANLPVLRQELFSYEPGKSNYSDFRLKTHRPERLYLVRAKVPGQNLPPGLEPGALVEVRGKIRPYNSTGSHHGRESPAATIRVFPGALTVHAGPSLAPWSGLRIRWQVLKLINKLYAGKERGLFCALITGEKRLLDKELRLLFIDTGTAHFLAISGLHVGLVMLFAMRLPFPRRVKTPCRLLALGLFVLLSGANTPVLRAALMIALHLLLRAAGRLPRALDTLGWTLLGLLFLSPASIGEPGFQLSFTATTAILAWTSMRGKETRERKRFLLAPVPVSRLPAAGLSLTRNLRDGFLVALVSSAVTAPLIATHFNRVHPLAPLLSICLYPLVALSLLTGLASILLGFIWLEAGLLVASAAAFFARMLNEFLAFSQTIPGHCFFLPPPGLALTSICYLLLAAGLSRKTRIPALLVATLTLPLILLLNLVIPAAGNPRLTHLDTGAGSAALLHLPANKSVFLIDACGKTPEGGRRLARSILRAGHRRIDGIFLTHPHTDHAGALPLLSNALDIGEVFCSSHFHRDDYGTTLLADARREGISIRTVERNQVLWLPGPEKVALRILYPDSEENLPLSREANEMSLSFFIEIGGRRIICLGDLEENGLARLFGSGENLNSEVLLLPHHGRNNRLYDTLLKKVAPRVVVVSGDGRGGGESTLRRIELSGIKTYSTWRGGGIRNEWKDAGIMTSYVGR